MLLYLPYLTHAESPEGGKRDKIHIQIKAYLNALVLTMCELRNFSCLSRTKQRERPLGCIIYSRHCLQAILSFVGNMAYYIFASAWGFRRCSFRQTGQCEGLHIVERASGWLHVLFLCICRKTKTNQIRDYPWSQ